MPKIAVSVFDELPRQRAFAAKDEAADHDVETRIVFDGERGAIPTRLHDLMPGSSIRWKNSEAGHLIFIWSGALNIAGERLNPGATLIVEHGASARAEGGPDGCTILVFNPLPPTDRATLRPGGNVHVLPSHLVPRVEKVSASSKVGAALFADSRCPTCAFWLHENRFVDAGFVIENHYHSEDEVIVVTQGEIVLGQRHYGSGTAVSVARNTIYGFKTGASGLTYINFRPGRPGYALAGQKDMIDELSVYADITFPPYQLLNPERVTTS